MYNALAVAATVLLVIHVALLLAAPYSRRYFWMKKAALAVGLGVAVTASFSIPLRTLEIPAILTGVVVGYVSLLISLSSASYSFRDGMARMRRCFRREYLLAATAGTVGLILAAAALEEVIWRAQWLSAFGAPGMPFGVGLFCWAHVVISHKVRVPKLIDMACFATLNSILYMESRSPWPIVISHVIRNYHLHTLRYVGDANYREVVLRSRRSARASAAALWHTEPKGPEYASHNNRLSTIRFR